MSALSARVWRSPNCGTWSVAERPTRSGGEPDPGEPDPGEPEILPILGRRFEVVREVAGAASEAVEPRRLAIPEAEPAEAIRLLGVHGVGNHSLDRTWQRRWREAMDDVADRLRERGLSPRPTRLEFAMHDDLFEAADLRWTDIVRAVRLLAGNAIRASDLLSGAVPLFEGSRRGGRGELSFRERLRWTAGMVVEWVENAEFRRALRDRLAAAIREHDPHVVLGHSLGSLVAYDLFNSPGGADLARGRRLVTLGSQIANPFIAGGWPEGRVRPLPEALEWVNLYNPDDDVFVRSFAGLPGFAVQPGLAATPAAWPMRFRELWTEFDVPGWADHAAREYLAHPATVEGLWTEVLAPFPLAEYEGRQTRGRSA